MSQHENDALQVQGDRVVLGEWSGDLEELIAKNVELRQMLREGRTAEARALIRTQAVEEQAALVAIDEKSRGGALADRHGRQRSPRVFARCRR